MAFLKSLAARTGQQLNYNNLAKEIGIDNKTVKSWLSVLQTSGIIYLLQPYSNNLSKRLTKSPKIYFLDTGLCCYLTNWPDATSLENGIMSGAILETYVFSELAIYLGKFWHNVFLFHTFDTDLIEIFGNLIKIYTLNINPYIKLLRH